MELTDEKYLALTTYKKNGEPKSLPIWIADLGDGTIGFTTASSSYKVKRLGNDPRLTLQPSDSRGNPRAGTEAAAGTGTVVTGDGFLSVRDAIKQKYGVQFTMISAIGRIAKLIGKGSGTDTAIIVTLDQ